MRERKKGNKDGYKVLGQSPRRLEFYLPKWRKLQKKQVLKDGFRKLGVQTHRLVMFEQQFRHPNGRIKWVNECTGMDLWLGISTWSCHSMVLKATKIKQDLQGCRIDRTEKRAKILWIYSTTHSWICGKWHMFKNIRRSVTMPKTESNKNPLIKN